MSQAMNDYSTQGGAGGNSGGGSGFSFSAAVGSFVRRIPMMVIVFVLIAGTGVFFVAS